VGTKLNHYKGTEIGGQSSKHILFLFKDKKFRAYPIDNWYDFKRQMVDVDLSVQQELQNFSNDPDYAMKLQKMKGKSKANSMIEDLSTQARAKTGLEETEEHEKNLNISSILTKKRENRNKEEADFDEFEEVFQDNDEDDVAQDGLDFIPDDDSNDDVPGVKNDNQKGYDQSKRGNLNEDGTQVLKVSILFLVFSDSY
jgi:hypothetical protein